MHPARCKQEEWTSHVVTLFRKQFINDFATCTCAQLVNSSPCSHPQPLAASAGLLSPTQAPCCGIAGPARTSQNQTRLTRASQATCSQQLVETLTRTRCLRRVHAVNNEFRHPHVHGRHVSQSCLRMVHVPSPSLHEVQQHNVLH